MYLHYIEHFIEWISKNDHNNPLTTPNTPNTTSTPPTHKKKTISQQ